MFTITVTLLETGFENRYKLKVAKQCYLNDNKNDKDNKKIYVIFIA